VRIALIGPAYPDQGAAARHTTELAYRLAAAGHNVIIESWRVPDPPDGASRRVPDPRHGESWRVPHPPDGDPYPRTYRRLVWYRPDTWIAVGRRLRSADLVVFALLSQAQVPSYLSVLTALALGPDRPRTAVICHAALPAAVRGQQGLTRTLLARADTVIVHSAAQAAQARALAAEVPIVIARMPPHLPSVAPGHGVRPPDPEPYWLAYLHALGASPS
jgi:Glycosyltransferase Family 4